MHRFGGPAPHGLDETGDVLFIVRRSPVALQARGDLRRMTDIRVEEDPRRNVVERLGRCMAIDAEHFPMAIRVGFEKLHDQRSAYSSSIAARWWAST
jgi:hypothetical protein